MKKVLVSLITAFILFACSDNKNSDNNGFTPYPDNNPYPPHNEYPGEIISQAEELRRELESIIASKQPNIPNIHISKNPDKYRITNRRGEIAYFITLDKYIAQTEIYKGIYNSIVDIVGAEYMLIHPGQTASIELLVSRNSDDYIEQQSPYTLTALLTESELQMVQQIIGYEPVSIDTMREVLRLIKDNIYVYKYNIDKSLIANSTKDTLKKELENIITKNGAASHINFTATYEEHSFQNTLQEEAYFITLDNYIASTGIYKDKYSTYIMGESHSPVASNQSENVYLTVHKDKDNDNLPHSPYTFTAFVTKNELDQIKKLAEAYPITTKTMHSILNIIKDKIKVYSYSIDNSLFAPAPITPEELLRKKLEDLKYSNSAGHINVDRNPMTIQVENNRSENTYFIILDSYINATGAYNNFYNTIISVYGNMNNMVEINANSSAFASLSICKTNDNYITHGPAYTAILTDSELNSVQQYLTSPLTNENIEKIFQIISPYVQVYTYDIANYLVNKCN